METKTGRKSGIPKPTTPTFSSNMSSSFIIQSENKNSACSSPTTPPLLSPETSRVNNIIFQLTGKVANPSKKSNIVRSAVSTMENGNHINSFPKKLSPERPFTSNAQKYQELEQTNQKLMDDNHSLKCQFDNLKSQLENAKIALDKEIRERQTAQIIQKEQNQLIKSLQSDLETQQRDFQILVDKNVKIRKRLVEILPAEEKNFNDDDDMIKSKTNPSSSIVETTEKMINEIGKLKMYVGELELQLYEKNEKISELLENNQILEAENTTLRAENSDVTAIAKLVTDNMKETIDTSKRMENTIRKMQVENEELARLNKPLSDEVDMRRSNGEEQYERISKTEVEVAQEQVNQKRFTEMVEGTIKEEYREKIRILEVKLEICERELKLALERADLAEKEVIKLKNIDKSLITKETATTTTTTLPPPPPPPLPPPLSIVPPLLTSINGSGGNEARNNQSTKPSSDPSESTDMDALIHELKTKMGTLRRQRINTNPALSELFETLHQNTQQNRNSKILINTQMIAFSSSH